MSWLWVISAGVVRLAFVFAPVFGFLRDDIRDFAIVPDMADEVREFASARTARIVILSWPVLVGAFLVARSDSLCGGGVAAMPLLIGFCILTAVFLAGLRLGTGFFRGTYRSILAFVVVTISDVTMNIGWGDSLTLLLCKAAAKEP